MSALDVFWDGCEGPIRFGVNDCCLVTADVILAAGGPDLMQGYRGRYSTAHGFVRAFRRGGHETLVDASLAMLRSAGRQVQQPANFDVGLVTYLDGPQRKPLTSPGFFHGGFWHIRSTLGGLILADGATHIHRIL